MGEVAGCLVSVVEAFGGLGITVEARRRKKVARAVKMEFFVVTEVYSLVILYCRPLEGKKKDGFCSGAATQVGMARAEGWGWVVLVWQ